MLTMKTLITIHRQHKNGWTSFHKENGMINGNGKITVINV